MSSDANHLIRRSPLDRLKALSSPKGGESGSRLADLETH